MLRRKSDELADILKSAALNPAYRAKFYRTLLKSDIFVIIFANHDMPNGAKLINVDKTISIISWKKSSGESFIPIFSSENQIIQAVKKTEKYIRIKSKTIFNTIHGARYVINPLSDYGKEMTEFEITSLLDGTLLKSNSRIKLEENTKILLGQPANYPYKLIEVLSTYFGQYSQIVKAYVVQMHTCNSGDEPHLLIALAGNVDLSAFFAEISTIIQTIIRTYECVDIIQVGKANELDSYFAEIEPFYMA